MISVLVPCLNEEEHLPSFLSSLAAQFWVTNFELVIVDGGSSDRSRKIVSEWEKHTGIHCTKLINETRNLGFVRNWGARAARGDILVFTNSDAILPENFLNNIAWSFGDPNLVALSGRTVPLEGGALGSVAYAAFDRLRWAFSKIGRFSPSGNFLAVRTKNFWRVGGFPEIRMNEDGVLGSRLSKYARERGVKVKFDRRLLTYHFSAKRWKGKGLKTLLFYSYVFGNFSPFLKRILSPILRKSSREFNVN